MASFVFLERAGGCFGVEVEEPIERELGGEVYEGAGEVGLEVGG